MSVLYPVLLAEVVVDATNGDIRFLEDATPHVATIAPGTYFLRGDGAADDLAKAVGDAFLAAGAFTYDPRLAVHATLGAGNSATFDLFQIDGGLTINGGHASTTFDVTLLGYPAADTVSFGSSPRCIWVGAEPLARNDPTFDAITRQTRMTGGQVRTFDRGGPYDVRELEVAFSPASRTFAGTDEPGASFAEWWARARDGRALELHEAEDNEGTLVDLDEDTLVGTFVLDDASCGAFRPRRFEPGLELYGWTLGLRGYVA